LSILRITRIILFILAVVFVVTGCLNKEPSPEKLYQVLEKVVEAEKEFEEQQKPLFQLEQQEKEIYNQIMTLGMKKHDEIVRLSDEALSIVQERRELLLKEVNSINASKNEFKKAADLKEKIKETELKKTADDLFKIMDERYRIHSQLSKEYFTALDDDKELYLILKNENISYDKLEAHVTKLNATYKKVYEANEKFNELTEQYNDKKLVFYKKAGLNLEK
jgi:hypothetical protein